MLSPISSFSPLQPSAEPPFSLAPPATEAQTKPSPLPLPFSATPSSPSPFPCGPAKTPLNLALPCRSQTRDPRSPTALSLRHHLARPHLLSLIPLLRPDPRADSHTLCFPLSLQSSLQNPSRQRHQSIGALFRQPYQLHFEAICNVPDDAQTKPSDEPHTVFDELG